jgi:hypothetical protein
MRKTSLSSFAAQRFQNGEVHGWYRCVHGFSDHLVGGLLDRFAIRKRAKILDPFCGTGTTLIECMKRGIRAVGVDANPASCFVSRVKTEWTVKGARLLDLLALLAERYPAVLQSPTLPGTDPTYRYLAEAGMLARGWISEKPLQKAIAIKSCIKTLPTTIKYRNALMLPLLTEVIHGASNIKFGPELYCGPAKIDWDVYSGFTGRAKKLVDDLAKMQDPPPCSAEVLQGDARQCDQLFGAKDHNTFAAVICSPPYPAEHDYTRNTRLELAFLEHVLDRTSLRAIKMAMLRSHTKGIYKDDNDRLLVTDHTTIASIVRRIDKLAQAKDHGFAELYSTVIREYFGGMRRHFRSLKRLLKSGAWCAYVVGDQSAYLRVHIPTARILGDLAEQEGYTSVEILPWRSRWSTSTSRHVQERILLFQNS